MDLSPKVDGSTPPIPDAKTRLPATLEEAVEYIESKFPSISLSDRMYEEENGIRSVHVSFIIGARMEGPETVKQLVQAWLLSMMDLALNSSRTKLWWRMRPNITVDWVRFEDGPAYALKIISRQSMV